MGRKHVLFISEDVGWLQPRILPGHAHSRQSCVKSENRLEGRYLTMEGRAICYKHICIPRKIRIVLDPNKVKRERSCNPCTDSSEPLG